MWFDRVSGENDWGKIMEISKLEKEVNYNTSKVKITVEITLDSLDFAPFDYHGFDCISDDMIPDILLAVSRRMKIKNGKLSAPSLMEKVRSIDEKSN